jgi:hypothetical protein
MASLTPEAQEIFGSKYDPADELWLGVFFTPSKQSQAAGRKYLARQRARQENRDPVGKVAPAQSSAWQRMGYSAERSTCVPEEDHSAQARGETAAVMVRSSNTRTCWLRTSRRA